jgi:NAD(P)H-hydrate epimerase
MRILNAAQMREADRRTIEGLGVPSLVLMENAGRQVVAAMEGAFDDLLSRHVAILCGRGNNGGDGFVVARTLVQRGVACSVFLLGQVAEVRGDARVNLEILGRLGIVVVELNDAQAWELHSSEIFRCDLIVDALFGTGLKTALSGLFETVVADINASSLPVVAIDLPSGLSADTHEIIGQAIDATVTVTMAAPKAPLVMPPAESKTGDLVIADIGIPSSVIDEVPGPFLSLLTREQMRGLVADRHADSHKGDFGRVLIVAGSPGRTGAAHLAGLGALRSGAGLVTVATPRGCVPIVAAMAPEYLTAPLEEDENGLVSEAAIGRVIGIRADVVAAGPGLGRGGGVAAFVRGLVEGVPTTLVLDADAINAFADDPDRLQGREGAEIVITPHPGEMARLLGVGVGDVQADRVESARGFAVTHRVYVVLKGHRTVIATPEGRVYLNPTGNPGMATGGTGDVLTGAIAAWCAQGLAVEAACKLGVYLHGLAGDLAEADEGAVAMTAGDLAARLGDAVLELTARRKHGTTTPRTS